MKKIILTIIVLSIACFVNGQSFQLEGNSPFNIETFNPEDSSNLAFKYLFYDNDQDGDYDLNLMGLGEQDTTSINLLFSLRYFIESQENMGSIQEPEFASRKQSFESFNYPIGEGFMIPAGGDLNNDGLIDFVVSAETDLYGTQYLQFQIQNPDGSFSLTNCLDWNLDPFLAYSLFIPELTDLDMDGDLDILLAGYHRSYDEDLEEIEVPAYLYAKNIGSPEVPEFLGWFENPYGLEAEGQSFFASGDLDRDGDMDLLNLAIVDDLPVLSFVENIGTTKPLFTAPVNSPFGLPMAQEEESFLFPSLVDIDGDGDLDLFLPSSDDEDFDLRYYKNQDCEALSADVSVSGSLITTDDQEGYIYSWIDCNTSEELTTGSQNTYVATYSGSYSVHVTDANGCMGRSECVEVVVSGTEEVNPDQSILIYPNPSDGHLFIDNQSAMAITAMRLYNAKGELQDVLKYAGQQEINISDWDAGIYLLELDLGSYKIVKKILLMK